MLRKALLVTTALVLGASVAYAGKPMTSPKDQKGLQKALHVLNVGHVVKGVPVTLLTSKRGSQPTHNNPPHLESATFNNFSKYANAQFVSWYGYTAANESGCYSSTYYHSCFSFVGSNAEAFTPAASVTTKKVTTAMFSYYPSAQYAVDIYSSSGGLPGSVIATSKTFSDSDTSLCCTSARTVSISASLNAGTQYFIGVVGTTKGGTAYGGWNMEDTDFSGAAVDYWHYVEKYSYSYSTGYTGHGTFSTPWHASTYIPATGAINLK